jgi:hypothetical protein
VNSIPIGYFPKQTVARPDWLEVPHVEQICSVSDHISSAPDGWMDHWLHNAFWAYDSPEMAWSVVPEGIRTQFDLYAWRIFPVRFARGEDQPLDMPDMAVAPLSSSFVRLGIDAVSRHLDAPFECSPLSCNYMAREIAVNPYCLIERESEAFQVARDFSRTEPEPGPYFLLEIWRTNLNINAA